MKLRAMRKKIPLSDSEIADICCQVIERSKTQYKDVSDNIYDNISNLLTKQLKKITIYPDKVPELIKELKRQFVASRMHPGEMLGVISATSIAEPATQN